jgi:hypothetical protein
MTRLTPLVVLSALLLAPIARAQTPAPAEPASPSAPVQERPPPSAEAATAPAPGTPERPAATPPRAEDFVGRMTLVTLGSVLGGAGFGALGLFGGSLLGGLSVAGMGAAVGLVLGTGIGASAFGALLPGSNLYATGGAFLGSLVGGILGLLTVTAGPVAIALPFILAVVGYGVGFKLAPPSAPSAARHDEGIQISPIVALSPRGGGGQVGLAGVF